MTGTYTNYRLRGVSALTPSESPPFDDVVLIHFTIGGEESQALYGQNLYLSGTSLFGLLILLPLPVHRSRSGKHRRLTLSTYLVGSVQGAGMGYIV